MLIYCDQPHANMYDQIYASYYPKSPHNSKHLFDIYTNTHIFWLMLFMFIGKKLCPDHKQEIATLLLIASSWFEIYENQLEQIIKYRRIEINSMGETSYRGDSLINSIGDLLGNFIGIYLGYNLDDSFCLLILIALFFVVTSTVGFSYWTDFIEFELKSIH